MSLVATRTFELTATVAAPPEAVIDFLIALDRHRGMHPYLESATIVATGADGDVPWWDWRVVERPAFGPIRYRIRFPARMSRLSPTSMRGSVRAAPGCTLDTETTAEIADGGNTIVRESTTVTAPLPLLGYMAKHAELAHARTFSLLAHKLDAH